MEGLMAVFDLGQQRMCVRVVYDGVASAGKTTNLRQLAELFATQKTCELLSPAEMDGRTLYFDWLQIAAGMVCGFPLVCQAITVPGQLVLTPRRRHLLATADVVVHVCDSEEGAVGRALEGLALFEEVERARGEKLPLVIQANKQDQAGALSGAALLGLLARPGVPIVEAIASEGIGVVDTFVAAVRGAVRSIQARVEKGEFRVTIQQAESAAIVLERLRAVEVDPEWAIELMLEEASNAFTVGEALANDVDLPSAEGTEGEGTNAASSPMRASELCLPAEVLVPALPTEHVPTGFIWPAHTGRTALRALCAEREMRAPVALDRAGAARLALGDFVLSTSSERRFESSEAARQALVRAARERTQLGPLLAPETVLVAQPAADGSTWLWTIVPRMPTIERLVGSRDPSELPPATVLAAFGGALADALKAQASHGAALVLSPSLFGMRHGLVRYVGEPGANWIGAAEGARRDVGRALLASLSTLASLCSDIEPAVAALESAIGARLSSEERATLAQTATWQPPGPAVAGNVAERLAEALSRGRRAA
jgi:signal recognition particle receptor subunit beta